MTIQGYKFIEQSMRSRNGRCVWNLGEWKRHEGKIEMCRSGFHAAPTPLDSLNHIHGNRWFVVEADGEVRHGDTEFVASDMRLIHELPTTRIATQFACWCARQSLEIYRKTYTCDTKPRMETEAMESSLFSMLARVSPDTDWLAAQWAFLYAESSALCAAKYEGVGAWTAARTRQNQHLVDAINHYLAGGAA